MSGRGWSAGDSGGKEPPPTSGKVSGNKGKGEGKGRGEGTGDMASRASKLTPQISMDKSWVSLTSQQPLNDAKASNKPRNDATASQNISDKPIFFEKTSASAPNLTATEQSSKIPVLSFIYQYKANRKRRHL